MRQTNCTTGERREKKREDETRKETNQAGFCLIKSSSNSSFPVLISYSDMGRRHCAGILYLSKSDGRTPSHLMSGVVNEAESYDMFLLPDMYTERIFKPYGSESTRPNTGIFRVTFSFLRKMRVATSGCPLAVIITQGYVL